jgi:hypothetical protein
MNILTKEQILNTPALPQKIVDVPEWNGSVVVRGMTADERDDFEDAIREFGLKNLRARMASMTIIDTQGARLFTESDIAELGSKSASALDRVVDVATKLSGLTQEAVDVLEKN